MNKVMKERKKEKNTFLVSNSLGYKCFLIYHQVHNQNQYNYNYI